MNVAYHLSRLGLRAIPISAVGRDFLGVEARRRLLQEQLSVRFIAERAGLPTGTARATIDPAGTASFHIARHVAWDRIVVSRALQRLPPPAAIAFGTLALREEANRRALRRLLARWPRALRVVDLNLRAPFDLPDAIDFALKNAQLVKVNETELGVLIDQPGIKIRAMERAVRHFARRCQLERICVTAGARGAGLLWEGKWYWEHARPVVVRDTVGAGDAFLGGLLAALLRHAAPAVALARACRLGEFVAARDGAMPRYVCDRRGRIRDAQS